MHAQTLRAWEAILWYDTIQLKINLNLNFSILLNRLKYLITINSFSGWDALLYVIRIKIMIQIQDHLDQGASKEPVDPIWARFQWFPSYAMIQVILYEHTGDIIIHLLDLHKFHLFLLLYTNHAVASWLHCLTLVEWSWFEPGHCIVFLRKTLLTQCLSPPRCINGYWGT